MKSFGWIYDKQGNVKQVAAPVYSTDNGLQTAKKHKKTQTGKIPASVGHSGFKTN